MKIWYSPLKKFVLRTIRKFFPVPRTPDYSKETDICNVSLVPHDKLKSVFSQALQLTDRGDGGLYLEFGVFNGRSLTAMYQAALAERCGGLTFIGVDSFEGLPEEVMSDDYGVWHAGQFRCSQALAISCLQRRGVNLDKVQLYKSWYRDLDKTVLADELSANRIRVVMIDCDAYSSARDALHFVTPYLTGPTVFLFDDWRLHDLDLRNGGEYKAFAEWVDQHPDFVIKPFIRYNRKSEGFVITPPTVTVRFDRDPHSKEAPMAAVA